MQAKAKFLNWVDSEPGIEVCPDVDMFHVFKEVRLYCNSRHLLLVHTLTFLLKRLSTA